jgi:Tol biopolymer transport system component
MVCPRSARDFVLERKVAENAGWPVWSPDRLQIAFVNANVVGGPNREGGIYVMNADGGWERLLARGGYQPVWSPDGGKIASQRPAGQQLHL